MFTTPWIWTVVTVICLGLCFWLPPRIHNNVLRRFVYLFILIPISIVIIVYVYPVGIDLCKQLALNWK